MNESNPSTRRFRRILNSKSAIKQSKPKSTILVTLRSLCLDEQDFLRLSEAPNPSNHPETTLVYIVLDWE
ncbi:hypothetical protein NP233_g12255 [Leucocoprinus birnbaumii]|uniref:Uncharacterized protein n=1 Tax=Leucocoprinus birnbaumii TaxID=56174 RepID=A0AAD5VG19_9AGAR|nr:hypothetical protein NP233_g12255 [Leucocoprinus birnbaumii]